MTPPMLQFPHLQHQDLHGASTKLLRDFTGSTRKLSAPGEGVRGDMHLSGANPWQHLVSCRNTMWGLAVGKSRQQHTNVHLQHKMLGHRVLGKEPSPAALLSSYLLPELHLAGAEHRGLICPGKRQHGGAPRVSCRTHS